jgi:hypothetical protein
VRSMSETGKSDCLVIDVCDITRRHSLVTVADLVGLPPEFNFKGEDVLEVTKRVEAAKKQNQHLLFDDCQSVDDIKAKVEDVDLFMPELSEVVKKHAELAWSQASPDHFQMSYSGDGFPERVDLKQDMLGQWNIEFTSGFKKAAQIAKPQPSLQDAFDSAEKWMSVNRGRTFNMKRQNAAWRKNVPSDAQVRQLRRMGIDVDWRKMNAGQVSDMLDFRKAQQQARARQKAVVAQCSVHAPSSVASAIIDSGTKQQASDDDGRQRTAPKAVACAPSSARDTAFASQSISRKWSAHGPRSEAHIRQRPRVIGPRRKIRLADLGLDGVTQTVLGRGPEFGEPTSNGMQAALATVFGLPLDAVPHFPDTEPSTGWWDRMNAWLAEHYGVVLVSCTAGTWEVPRVLHLTQGNTVRDVPHVVVSFGGQLLHDPHPSPSWALHRALARTLSRGPPQWRGGPEVCSCDRRARRGAVRIPATHSGTGPSYATGPEWGEALHAVWASETARRIPESPAAPTRVVLVQALFVPQRQSRQ